MTWSRGEVHGMCEPENHELHDATIQKDYRDEHPEKVPCPEAVKVGERAALESY